MSQTWVLAYFPIAASWKCRTLFLTCFPRRLSLLTFLRQIKRTLFWSAPAIPVSEEVAETIWHTMNAVSDVLKYIQFFQLSFNIQALFYWERKGELYTNYHIWLISWYKDLKTKVVSWFSLVIGQTASHQLATSSENLVASVQFLVALVTISSSEILFGLTPNSQNYQCKKCMTDSKEN